MNSNNNRFDLSDRLIHFFRDVDLTGESAPELQPEHFAFNSFVEGTTWPALFLLRCAVRSHRLWATWSIRKNERTIYGPNPAVCFSEMPLAAFLESSQTREAAGQAMSTYALTFSKPALHKLGARPVIYGLSDKDVELPDGTNCRPRIFPGKHLPEIEQYRYVTFNPSGPRKVDWTHEREWRWPYTEDFSEVEAELEEFGVVSSASSIPGFDFSHSRLQGVGIIVKTSEDARKLRHDVLCLIDRGVVSRHHFNHLLVLDQLPAPSSLYVPEATESAIKGAMLDFDEFFDVDVADVAEVVEDFSSRVRQLEKSVASPTRCARENGGCWLWLHDNTHPYVRALVQEGRVFVNNEGRYLAWMNELDSSRELEQRKQLVLKLAEDLEQVFSLPCGAFFVMNSVDPDQVPFFIDRDPEDDLFNNTDF